MDMDDDDRAVSVSHSYSSVVPQPHLSKRSYILL